MKTTTAIAGGVQTSSSKRLPRLKSSPEKSIGWQEDLTREGRRGSTTEDRATSTRDVSNCSSDLHQRPEPETDGEHRRRRQPAAVEAAAARGKAGDSGGWSKGGRGEGEGGEPSPDPNHEEGFMWSLLFSLCIVRVFKSHSFMFPIP